MKDKLKAKMKEVLETVAEVVTDSFDLWLEADLAQHQLLGLGKKVHKVDRSTTPS